MLQSWMNIYKIFLELNIVTEIILKSQKVLEHWTQPCMFGKQYCRAIESNLQGFYSLHIFNLMHSVLSYQISIIFFQKPTVSINFTIIIIVIYDARKHLRRNIVAVQICLYIKRKFIRNFRLCLLPSLFHFSILYLSNRSRADPDYVRPWQQHRTPNFQGLNI